MRAKKGFIQPSCNLEIREGGGLRLAVAKMSRLTRPETRPNLLAHFARI